jgi:hypothetical protein
MNKFIRVKDSGMTAKSMAEYLKTKGYKQMFEDIVFNQRFCVINTKDMAFTFVSGVSHTHVETSIREMFPSYPYIGRFKNEHFDYLVFFTKPKTGMVIKLNSTKNQYWREEDFEPVEIKHI